MREEVKKEEEGGGGGQAGPIFMIGSSKMLEPNVLMEWQHCLSLKVWMLAF